MNFGAIHYNQDLGIKKKYNPGYFLGGSGQWKIRERFALGADVQFSMKADRLGTVGQPDENDIRFQNFNLEIAPRATYFFTKNFGVSLGIYAARLLKQRTKIPGAPDWKETHRNFYGRGWDAGLAPGIAMQFGRVSGFLRYTQGLVDIDRLTLTNDQGEEVGTVKLFNRYFQAGVGYVIFE